jgi:hypothetical protein
LTNHWQLSGVLRWSLPILIVLLQKGAFIKNAAMKITFIAAAIAATVLLYRIQYRNAAQPAIFLLLWMAISRQALRDLLAILACIYSIACPFVFSSNIYHALVTGVLDSLPTSLLGMFNFEEVIRFSGRVGLWSQFVDEFSNAPIVIGMGHSGYNGLKQIGEISPEVGMEHPEVTHLQFHQSFLDLIGIYGLIPAVVIVVLLCRMFGAATFLRKAKAIDNGLPASSLALLSLALAFLSMSMDSFMKEDNSFYFILFVSIIGSKGSGNQSRKDTPIWLRDSIAVGKG